MTTRLEFGNRTRLAGHVALVGSFVLLPGIFCRQEVYLVSSALHIAYQVCEGLSQRALQQDADARALDLASGQVLFLRSFGTDETSVLSAFGYGPRYEQHLVRVLGALGPVVAIGRPGEFLPPAGASRMYVPDAEWQVTVRRLMQSARLVVLFLILEKRPGGASSQTGFDWEIDELIRQVPPDRLLLVLPQGAARLRSGGYHDPLHTGRLARRFAKQGQAALERLRLQWRRPWPQEVTRADFVTFTSDGTPQLHVARWWRHVNTALEPWLRAQGIPRPMPPWWDHLRDERTLLFVAYLTLGMSLAALWRWMAA